MIRYIIPVILLCTILAEGMETNTPLAPDQIALEESLEQLRNILKGERSNKGAFIKSIIDDLKECTNGKMIELNFLTVKSSYWWDKSPYQGFYFQPHNFNTKKELIIDRKFRSSIYDRERHDVPDPVRSFFYKSTNGLDITNLLNSWESVREKVKFFENKDLPPNTIPDSLKEILGYGLDPNKKLDTYPSIFQMIRALKTLKYETKEPTKCSVLSEEIAKKEPSKVILEGVKNILSNTNYSDPRKLDQ